MVVVRRAGLRIWEKVTAGEIRYYSWLSFKNELASVCCFCFFFQAEDGIRDLTVTGVQTCALPIFQRAAQLCGVSDTSMDGPLDRFVTHTAELSRSLNGHVLILAFLWRVLFLFASGHGVLVSGSKFGPRHDFFPSFNRASAVSARNRQVSTSSCCESQRSRSWAWSRSTAMRRSTS